VKPLADGERYARSTGPPSPADSLGYASLIPRTYFATVVAKARGGLPEPGELNSEKSQ